MTSHKDEILMFMSSFDKVNRLLPILSEMPIDEIKKFIELEASATKTIEYWQKIKPYVSSCNQVEDLLKILSYIQLKDIKQFITTKLNGMNDDMLKKICLKIRRLRPKMLLISGWIRENHNKYFPVEIFEIIQLFARNVIDDDVLQKGNMLDVRITDKDNQSLIWTKGTICNITDDRVEYE